ncbi:hypothetical protein Mgra_00002461 [Meloidogyne graminicola]|uniref:MYND-type domain-containing protein n=1 Tax=Meloidogyne graminicola TaxID=189291 RepID=A0A8S9ZXH5_9BILA|nr:hypothetical protein Mgra_00002461 [Meloidogyne graminicola]
MFLKKENNFSKFTLKELKNLTNNEELIFKAIEEENIQEFKHLLEKIRPNCLEKNGMSPLVQACFKGNEEMVKMLLEIGADADIRYHDQGYTPLMFAALAGKPKICQLLLDSGASTHAENSIGKTAGEMAAFVGQYECVSVINAHIGIEDINKILHPQGEKSEKIYPNNLVNFIHRLTKTHLFHPVRLIFDVIGDGIIWENKEKTIWTVDRIFEKQLRTKEPNEVMSIKLWIVLFTLKEMLKYVDKRIKSENNKNEEKNEEEEEDIKKKFSLEFVKTLLNDQPEHLIRHNEELFIRKAILSFPYKQSMLWQALCQNFKTIEFGFPPSAFNILCNALLGHRYVQTSQFCRTCSIPSAKKRCPKCKSNPNSRLNKHLFFIVVFSVDQRVFYCSIECQRFDWPFHKKCCENLKKRKEKEEEMNEE